MDSGTIAIRRFSSVYTCSPKQDAGQRTRDRLDAIVRSGISRQVAAMAAALARGDDKSVCVIRQLAFRCVINAAWDDDRIAQAWAKQLVLALAMELDSGGTADIIRFDSPAAQLAHFIADLASGDAFSKWYNRRFAGLRSLPASIAIRTALVEAGPDGLEALRALTSEQFESILHMLSPGDALLVLQAFAAMPDAARLTDVLLLAMSTLRRRPPYALSDPRWGLAVFVAASREHLDCARTLVVAVAAVALHGLRQDAIQGKGLPPSASPHGTWPEALGGMDALDQIPSTFSQQLPVFSVEEAEPVHTPFGAGFVLLPVLLSLPFEDWIVDCPMLDSIPAERLLRALVLAACQGPSHCLSFLGDPAWLELLGLPAHTDWPTVAARLGTLGPKAQRAMGAGLANHARDQGGEPRLNKVVRAGAQAWRITHDSAGYWHLIAAVNPTCKDAGPEPDAVYLTGLQALPLTPGWQRLLGLAAQQVLRRFARRLPGFALSHLDYLHRNFLSFSATMEARGGRTKVSLGRPPLALMLNLAGMTRTEYALPWQPGHVYALYAEDS